MSDNAFLFHVLEDGKWHSQDEILQRSMRERGCRLTVHSRAADLRKRGCVVENQLRRTGTGRASSYYRLVALNEPVAVAIGEVPSDGTGSLSVPADPTPLGLPSSADESASPPAATAGTLHLFECVVDESAGLRDTYWEPDAA